MSTNIEVNNLTKTFGKKKKKSIGVSDICLSLENNRLIGLLGPNGAGKTTLLKILARQLHPTSGTVRINGSVCYVNDFEESFTLHSVSTLLDLSKHYYTNWSEEIATELVTLFSIDVKKTYSKLSKGQQGLVNIIIGFASNAKTTIFDESHIALDAVMRKRFMDLLIDFYTDSDRSFILSTHYINEASNIFEDVLIMNHGHLLLHTTKDAIEEMAICITGDYESTLNLIDKDKILSINKLGSSGEFHYYGQLSDSLRQQLVDSNSHISRMPLESFFINIVNKEVSHEEHQ